MLRQHERQSQDIRTDAIAMAIKKMGEGCEGCAYGYFNLARTHGATEEEIERAITGMPNSSGNALSRADALKLAAIGAARIGALAAASTAFPQLVTHTAVARTGAASGAQVIWVIAQMSQGTVRLIGIAADGGIVGQINPADTHVLRSLDGASLYVLSAPMGGMNVGSSSTPMTSATHVDVYDAATGTVRTTIPGRTISLGSGPNGFEALVPALSSDGRYLAVLRQVNFIVTANVGSVLKPFPDGTTRTITIDQVAVINGLEVFDLVATRSVDYIQLDSSPSNGLGGRIMLGPDSRTIYVFTSDRAVTASAKAITFDGSALRVSAQAVDRLDGHAIPTIGPAIGSTQRILSDGRTLVRLGPSTVQLFDLSNLTLTQHVDLPLLNQSAKAYPSIALFASDESIVYVVNVANATVQAVNVATRTLGARLTLPPETQNPAAPSTIRFAASLWGASLSADGNYLYLIDGRGGDGVWVLHLPDLQVVAHWLAGHYLRSVTSSVDRQTVFAVELDGSMVYALDTVGNVTSTTPTGANVYGVIGSDTAQFA